MFAAINRFYDRLFRSHSRVWMFITMGVLELIFILEMINGFMVSGAVSRVFQFSIFTALLLGVLFGVVAKSKKLLTVSALVFAVAFICMEMDNMAGESGFTAFGGVVMAYFVVNMITWLIGLAYFVLHGLAYAFGYKTLRGVANFVLFFFLGLNLVNYILAIIAAVKMNKGVEIYGISTGGGINKWALYITPLLMEGGILFFSAVQYEFLPEGFSGLKRIKKHSPARPKVIVEDEEYEVEADEDYGEEEVEEAPKPKKKPSAAPKRKKPEIIED